MAAHSLSACPHMPDVLGLLTAQHIKTYGNDTILGKEYIGTHKVESECAAPQTYCSFSIAARTQIIMPKSSPLNDLFLFRSVIHQI